MLRCRSAWQHGQRRGPPGPSCISLWTAQLQRAWPRFRCGRL